MRKEENYPVKPIEITVHELDREMKRVEAVFKRKESEETWEMHNSALKNMTRWILKIDAHKQTSFIDRLKNLKTQINTSLLSERSRLSGTAMEMLKTLSKAMKTDYQDLHELFAPTLFSLFRKTSKVTHTRALECYKSIANDSSIPKGIRHLCLALKKPPIPSKSVRECVLECIKTLIQVNDPNDIVRYTQSIEETIKNSAKDPSAEVRLKARACYKAYYDKFTDEAERFISSLSDDVKKYLIPTPSASSSTSTSYSTSTFGNRTPSQSTKSLTTRSNQPMTKRALGNPTPVSRMSKTPARVAKPLQRTKSTQKDTSTPIVLPKDSPKETLPSDVQTTVVEPESINEDPILPSPDSQLCEKPCKDTFVQSESDSGVDAPQNEGSLDTTPLDTQQKDTTDQNTIPAETQSKGPSKKVVPKVAPSPTTHRGQKRVANADPGESRLTKQRIEGRVIKRPVPTRLSTARQSAVRSSMSLPDTDTGRRSPNTPPSSQRPTTYHKLPRVATLSSKSSPLLSRSSITNNSPSNMSPRSTVVQRSPTGSSIATASSSTSSASEKSVPFTNNSLSDSPKPLKPRSIHRKPLSSRVNLCKFDIKKSLGPTTRTQFKRPFATSGPALRRKRAQNNQGQNNESRALERNVKKT